MEESDSDEDLDEFKGPPESARSLRTYKSSPSGYDAGHIEHFWRHYHDPRPEKEKKVKPREAP